MLTNSCGLWAGKKPITGIDPDEAVAVGATIMATMLVQETSALIASEKVFKVRLNVNQSIACYIQANLLDNVCVV